MAQEAEMLTAHEAIRLGRVLRALMPDEPEVAGLLALMLLTDARRAARLDAGGALVTLDVQDRSLWDHAAIAEGHTLVRECLRRKRPGHYQLLVAVWRPTPRSAPSSPAGARP